MTNAPIYEIRTVLDFLKVPPERLDDCLEEFQVFLALAAMFDPALVESGAVKLPSVFPWKDNGRRDIDIKISITSKND